MNIIRLDSDSFNFNDDQNNDTFLLNNYTIAVEFTEYIKLLKFIIFKKYNIVYNVKPDFFLNQRFSIFVFSFITTDKGVDAINVYRNKCMNFPQQIESRCYYFLKYKYLIDKWRNQIYKPNSKKFKIIEERFNKQMKKYF